MPAADERYLCGGKLGCLYLKALFFLRLRPIVQHLLHWQRMILKRVPVRFYFLPFFQGFPGLYGLPAVFFCVPGIYRYNASRVYPYSRNFGQTPLCLHNSQP